jgi:hypothetical protein
MAFVQNSEETLGETKAHCSSSLRIPLRTFADLADRLEGSQRVPQRYGSSWQYMMEFLHSFMRSLLALYWERLLGFTARHHSAAPTSTPTRHFLGPRISQSDSSDLETLRVSWCPALFSDLRIMNMTLQ